MSTTDSGSSQHSHSSNARITTQPRSQPSKSQASKTQASSRPIRVRRNLLPFTCVCSKVAQGYVRLKSHQRACTVFKKLLLNGHRAANINTASIDTNIVTANINTA